MNIDSAFSLPGTFSTSTVGTASFQGQATTFGPAIVPIQVLDLPKDLIVDLVFRFPPLPIVPVDPAFPYLSRFDLPLHERKISAEALQMLCDGIAAVRDGNVRQLSLDELVEPDDE